MASFSVRRFNVGGKDEVVTTTEELDAWWKSRETGAAENEQSGGGLRLSEHPDHEPHRSVELRPPRRASSRLVAFVAIPLLALGGVVAALNRVHGHARQPFSVEVRGITLQALDSTGERLWTHRFADGLTLGAYEDEDLPRRHALGDIQGAGRMDVLFAHFPRNESSVGSNLKCFSESGKVLWEFRQERHVETAGGRKFTPPYLISNVQVLKPSALSPARIVVSANHNTTYPNSVTFLDASGKMVGEYWHMGHLLWLAQADLDDDGVDELLLGGINNSRSQAVLVVLEPHKIRGVFRSGEVSAQQFVKLPPLKEKLVVRFPGSSLLKPGQHNQVNHLRINKDRILVGVLEGPDKSLHPGPGTIVYEFDHSFRLENVIADVLLTGNHAEMKKRGAPRLQDELKALKEKVEVVR